MKHKNQPSEDQLPDLLQQLRSKGDGLRSPQAAYFEHLADKVVQQQALTQQNSNAPRPSLLALRSLKQYVRWAAVAASVLLCVWLGWQSIGEASTQTATVSSWEAQLDALSQEELTDYIQENIQEFELETLLANNN